MTATTTVASSSSSSGTGGAGGMSSTTTASSGNGGGGAGGGGGGAGGAGGAGGGAGNADVLWSVVIPSPQGLIPNSASNATATLNDLVVDGQGNPILVGSFDGTIDFGGPPLTAQGVPTNPAATDGFTIKYSADGAYLWGKKYGAGLPETWLFGKVDAGDNLYVMGSHDQGQSPATPTCLTGIYDPQGMLTGSFDCPQVGPGMAQNNVQEISLAVNAAGHTFTSTTVTTGLPPASQGVVARSLTWSKNVPAQPPIMTVNAPGDLVVYGHNESAEIGCGQKQGTLFVARLKEGDGSCMTSRAFTNMGNLDTSNVATDASGNIYLAGTFGGSVSFGDNLLWAWGGNNDIYVAKLDPSGNFITQVAMMVSGQAGDVRLAIDPSGGLYLTGQFSNTITFQGNVLTAVSPTDNFIFKLSANLVLVSGKHIGTPGSSCALHPATDAAGHLFLGGNCTGTVDFGMTQVATQGILLAKLPP
ncbi:MAG: hypothetical protein U0359_16000 [Byssovorax sp.]